MKTCDVCGKNIEFWENVGWVHVHSVLASGRDPAGHRAIPVDDECEHGVVVGDFGACQECVRSLQGDLDQLERTDPEVARAAAEYDLAVRRAIRGERRRRTGQPLGGLGRCVDCGVEVGAAHECARPGRVRGGDVA